ncbi:hypothetical protein AAOGI_44360 [Agarivorans albus]
MGKVVITEELLPHDIEEEVTSVYIVKLIFGGMRKTYWEKL